MMKEQEEINRQFEKALQLVGNGHYVFGTENKYQQALMMVLTEALNDKDEFIDWWFYEATPDYKVWSADREKEWCLKEPEALYDFIVNEWCGGSSGSNNQS